MLATSGWHMSEGAQYPSAASPVPADSMLPGSQPRLHSFSGDQQGLTEDQKAAVRHTRGKETAPASTASTPAATDQHPASLSGPNPNLSQMTLPCSSSAARVQEQTPMAWRIGATHGHASAGPLRACQAPQAAHPPHHTSTAAPVKALALRGLHTSAGFAANAGLGRSHEHVESDENADPASLGGGVVPLSTSADGLPGSSCPGQVAKAAVGMQAWRLAQGIHTSPSEASSDEDLAAHEDPECSGDSSIHSIARCSNSKGTSTGGCLCRMPFELLVTKELHATLEVALTEALQWQSRSNHQM